MTTITFFAPATRSIAPPMPGTILPGTMWLAKEPSLSTCKAPRIVTSTCPPLMKPKEVAESKKLANL